MYTDELNYLECFENGKNFTLFRDQFANQKQSQLLCLAFPMRCHVDYYHRVNSFTVLVGCTATVIYKNQTGEQYNE